MTVSRLFTLPVWVWSQSGIGMFSSQGFVMNSVMLGRHPISSQPTDPGPASQSGSVTSVAEVRSAGVGRNAHAPSPTVYVVNEESHVENDRGMVTGRMEPV